MAEIYCPGGHVMAAQGQFKDLSGNGSPHRGFGVPERNYAEKADHDAVDAALKAVLDSDDVTVGIQARIQRSEKKA